MSTAAEIFDFDGTLCDISSAVHHFAEGADGFHRFHLAAQECPANADIVCAARRAVALGRDVIIVTARPSRYRAMTEAWLAHQQVPYLYLLMRPNGNAQPDAELKRDILTAIRRADFDVVRAWEDNPSVVAVWESSGIPVDVVPGWVDPHVREAQLLAS